MSMACGANLDSFYGEALTLVENDINNVPRSSRIFSGSDPATGQIFFAKGRQGYGYALLDSWTGKYVPLPPACNLAMGITELCIAHGYGKVFYMSNNRIGFPLSPTKLTSHHTPANEQLPHLLYVHFKWDDESCEAWYSYSHFQRLQQLSARGNAIPLDTPVMPIALAFEKDNYDNITIPENLSTISLAYNLCGNLYLSWYADITAHGTYHCGSGRAGSPDRFLSIWQIDKTDEVDRFRMRTGAEGARRLKQMYQERRPESICLYRTIVAKAIVAHDEWAANGGYSIENDRTIKPDHLQKFIASSAGQIDGAIPAEEPGQRLRELMAEHDNEWTEQKRRVLRDYRSAANEGIGSVNRFIINDAAWVSLSKDHQRRIVEFWALEQEATERAESITPSDVELTRERAAEGSIA